MHPDDFPGAASIAFNYAKILSKEMSVEFWHTTLGQNYMKHEDNLFIRGFHQNLLIDFLVKKFFILRLFLEFVSPFLLLRIAKQISDVRKKK